MFGWERLAAVRPSRWKRRRYFRVFEVWAEDLDGDGPVEDLVATEKDGGHAARADLAHEHEPARRRLTRALRGPSPRLDDLPAHGAREGLEGVLEAEQSLDRQRLLAVAQRLAGIVVALDYQAVSLRGDGGLGQRHDQVAAVPRRATGPRSPAGP